MKLTVNISDWAAVRLNKLVELGYGETRRDVVEYFIQRELDDMLRSKGLCQELKDAPYE